jgi:hypothetical protein
MSFNPVEVCGPDPWIDVARIVLLWIVPVVLFVIRRQVPAGCRNAGLLSVAFWLSAFVAALMSLPWLDLIDRLDPIYSLATAQVARTAAFALGAVYLYRSVCSRLASPGDP